MNEIFYYINSLSSVRHSAPGCMATTFAVLLSFFNRATSPKNSPCSNTPNSSSSSSPENHNIFHEDFPRKLTVFI